MNSRHIETILSAMQAHEFFEHRDNIILSTVREQNATKAVNEICEKLSLYSFDKLYFWIAATAIHPNNQLFTVRFESALACLLSVPAKKFANKKLTYKDFCKLLHEIDKTISLFTASLEDFEPFYQLKKIPLFTPDAKYYFFYGSYEQPYLIWKHLVEIIYPVLSKLKHPLVSTIKASLEFQTRLITRMDDYVIIKEKPATIIIPPQDFLDGIGEEFLTNFSDEFAKTITSGALEGKKDLIDFAIDGGLYDVLLVKHKGRKFFWLPFDHYDAISRIIKKTILNNTLITRPMMEYSTGHFCNAFFGLFNLTNGVKSIYSTDNEVLTQGIDAMATLDEQNVVLFKITPLAVARDIEVNINKATTCIHDTIERILKNDLVLFERFNNRKYGFPRINYWGVVVYDVLASEFVAIPGVDDENIFLYSFDDLCRCFEKSPSADALLNFFIDDRKQSRNTTILSPDMLDRFESYLSGSGFGRMGLSPAMIVYAPHVGSIAVQSEMYEKFQDPIHEIVYDKLGSLYDTVKKHSADCGYDIYMKSTGAGGMGMLLGNHLLFIRFPWTIIHNESKDKVMHCSNLLAPLILNIVDRLKEKIIITIDSWDIQKNISDFFQIDLIPAQDADLIDVFHGNIDLSLQCPVICKTFIKHDKILTGFVYDPKYLHGFFSLYSDNTAEKIIFVQLYSAWLMTCGSIDRPLAIESSSRLFDGFIGKEQKGFSLDAIPVKNPLLTLYQEPYDFDEIILGHKQKEIAEFLYGQNIMPGTYHADDAKKICNKIFNFLWDELIEKLSQLNCRSLFFIYRQIELIEGRRETQQLAAGLQARIRTEFDLEEKYRSEYKDLVKLLEASKYIFQIAFSLSQRGNEHLTRLNWQTCLSLGWWIGEISHISDALHFETADFALSINDMYEFSISYNGSRFCFEEFQVQQAKSSIRNDAKCISSRLHQEKKDETALLESCDTLPWLSIVDPAFLSEFGVTFSSLNIIADSLRFVESQSNDFPIKIFDSIEQLTQGIKNTLVPEDGISDKDIYNALNFMTMSRIDVSTPLLPSKISTLNKRINIAPIVEIDGQIAYGNQMTILSLQLLTSILGNGAQPFDLTSHPELKAAINRVHRARDLELENEVYIVAQKCLGKSFVEKNISNFRRISNKLPQRPQCGEIDVIAVNRKSKIIFILDAKNQKRGREPAGISREAEDFWGPGGHSEQLHKKEQFVADNMAVFLHFFHVYTIEGWKTKSAFIVQTNYVSAFLVKHETDFVLLSDLTDYLLKDN